MDNMEILEQISSFKASRQSFDIIDSGWLWYMKVMILWIQCKDSGPDILTIIDMLEFNESSDVLDYRIDLPALVKARRKYLEVKKG